MDNTTAARALGFTDGYIDPPIVDPTLRSTPLQQVNTAQQNKDDDGYDDAHMYDKTASEQLTLTPSTPYAPTGSEGGPFSPAYAEYTVSNEGLVPSAWAVDCGAEWLTATPSSGGLAPGQSSVMRLAVNDATNELTDGEYSAVAVFSSNTNKKFANTAATVTVSGGAGVLTVSVGDLTSSGYAGGGPVDVAYIDYTLQNTGTGALTWTATSDQAWLTLAPASGSLAAGGSTTVRALLNANINDLNVGSYSAVMTFAQTGALSSTVRQAALTLAQGTADSYSEQFTDAFTGNGVSLTAHSAAWTTTVGALSLDFGTCITTVSAGQLASAYVNTPAFSCNHYAETAVSYAGTAGSLGVLVRSSADGRSGYALLFGRNPNAAPGVNSNKLRLFRVDNGVLTQLGADGPSPSTNDVLRLEASGTTLTPKLNGALITAIGQQVDATYLTPARPGLFAVGSQDPAIDNFKAGNIVSQFSVAVTPLAAQSTVGFGSSWAPTTLSVDLLNTGGSSVNWTATLLNADWFALNTASGALASNASAALVFTPNATAQAKDEGAYPATLAVTYAGNIFLRSVVLMAATMSSASRTLGAAPLGVMFDATDVTADNWHAPNQTADVPLWSSAVIQPRGWTAQPVNCTGVTIIRCEYGMPLGAGTLTYNNTAHTLTWAAQGESAGAPVVIAADNEYALASSGGKRLYVWVTALPSGNQTDTLTIENGGIHADWNSFAYAWDFGDASAAGDPGIQSFAPGSWYYGARKADGSAYAKNKARGWQTAHVYQSAGDYVATLTVTDDTGATHTYRQPISVNDGRWTTYYFATSGDDNTGAGTLNSPYKTWTKARTLVGSNVRLLFKRGDTFNASAQLDVSSAATVTLGAWGSGARPVIQAVGNINLVNGGSSTDLRVIDVQLVGSQSINNQMGLNTGTHTLVLRTRVEQFYYGINAEYTYPVIVQECDLDQNPYQIKEEDGGAKFSYNIWSTEQSGLAVLGCYLTGFTDNIVRTYSNKVVLAHCKSRSFYHNRVIRLQGTEPLDGHLYTGRWLSAYYGDLDTHYKVTGDGAAGSTTPVRQLRFEGNAWTAFASDAMIDLGCVEYVTVVNNHATAPDAYPAPLVTISPGYPATETQPYVHNLNVFNNTLYSQATSADVQTQFLAIYHAAQDGHSTTVDSASAAARVYNNVLYAPTAKAPVTSYFINLTPVSGVLSPGWLTAHNAFYAPLFVNYSPFIAKWGALPAGDSTLAQFQAAGQDLGSLTSDPQLVNAGAGDLQLQVASPCRSNGLDTRVWARVDANGATRSAASMGAYE